MDNLSVVYIIPLVYLFAGISVGIITEKLVLGRLRHISHKTKWRGDEVLANAFRGMGFFLGFLTGMYLAVQHLPQDWMFKSMADKILFSFAVLLVTIVAGRIIVGFITLKTSGLAGILPSTSIIANITRIVIFIIGILVILQTLGISVTPILTALGVGGLAVALALQDSLSNLFSGIQVIASQQIRTGDYIKLETGEEGYVIDINWRNTTIRSLPNNMIIVPNSKLAAAIITNCSLPDKEIGVVIDIGVSYECDLADVEQITIKAAKEVMRTVEGGIEAFEPFIRFHSFGESSINFSVILRAKEFVNQYLIKHEFIKALHKRYKESLIEIPFPIRTVLLKKPVIN